MKIRFLWYRSVEFYIISKQNLTGLLLQKWYMYHKKCSNESLQMILCRFNHFGYKIGQKLFVLVSLRSSYTVSFVCFGSDYFSFSYAYFVQQETSKLCDFVCLHCD